MPVIQSFISIPRDLSSLRITRFIQAETEASPSWSRANLIPSSSCGSTRSAICLLPFALMVVDTCQTPDYIKSVNQVYDTSHSKATRPGSAGTLTEPLTSNVGDNAMAISKFTFIFAAIKRSTPDRHPVKLRVLATNERDARKVFAATHVLAFAGRMPARVVAV